MQHISGQTIMRWSVTMLLMTLCSACSPSQEQASAGWENSYTPSAAARVGTLGPSAGIF